MPESSPTRSATYSAVPVVRVDGRASERLDEAILSMVMNEQEGGLSSLELTLLNLAHEPDAVVALRFSDEAELKLGGRLVVATGDAASPTEIFRGEITGFEEVYSAESPPTLTVLAEDALQRARMARRSAVYEQQSAAELIRRVAERLGLRARVDGLEQTLPVAVQHNESDLAFLRRTLEPLDGDLQIVGDELRAGVRASLRRGELELELYSGLRSLSARIDLAHQATAVTASGWDPAQGARVNARSDTTALGPGAGREGAQLLRETLGERVEHIGHHALATDAEASALVNAARSQRARRLVVVDGVAEGNPALRVGTHLRLRGLSARLENTYAVTRASHQFSLDRGYETHFQACCAWLGAAR